MRYFSAVLRPFAVDAASRAASGVLCEQRHTRQKSLRRTASRPLWALRGYAAAYATTFPGGAGACAAACAAAAHPGTGTAPTANAASGGGAAVPAAQRAAAPLFYLQSTGFFSFLRRCRAFFRPGTQQLDGVRSPVQKANRACTQYALFLLYTLHGLKQALT